jgi:sulfoxide reductase heme-binding subunit YedZ
MAWFAARWRWALLNLTAALILVIVLSQVGGEWHQAGDGFDSMLESGKWGIRFLLLTLAMTPLHIFLRWSSALKLRKSAGLWAFAFGAMHFGQYAIETWEPTPSYRVNGTPWHWLAWPMQLYIALGLLALLILTALAVTSNRWSMRYLGRNWKRLHRLVYGAGVAITCHALLAAGMSKRMMVRDPQAVTELRVYLGVLVVLLLIRIPQARSLLLKLVAVARPQQRRVAPIAPNVIPIHAPPLPQWPIPQLQEPTVVVDETSDANDAVATPSREREVSF